MKTTQARPLEGLACFLQNVWSQTIKDELLLLLLRGGSRHDHQRWRCPQPDEFRHSPQQYAPAVPAPTTAPPPAHEELSIAPRAAPPTPPIAAQVGQSVFCSPAQPVKKVLATIRGNAFLVMLIYTSPIGKSAKTDTDEVKTPVTKYAREYANTLLARSALGRITAAR